MSRKEAKSTSFPGEEEIFGHETDDIIKNFWALGLLFCLIMFFLVRVDQFRRYNREHSVEFELQVILAIHGILSVQPRLLLYHLIAQSIGLLLSFGVVVLGCVVIFKLAKTKETKDLWTATLVIVYATISINCYALWIGFKSYRYLTDLRAAINHYGRSDTDSPVHPSSADLAKPRLSTSVIVPAV